MVRFHIRINTGDNDTTNTYYFVHKDYAEISNDEQEKAFDSAVKELDRIYKTYGRFATPTGVVNLFKDFGFEQAIKN